MNTFFQKHFPVPDFLRMPSVGVVVTPTEFRFAMLALKDQTMHITECGVHEATDMVQDILQSFARRAKTSFVCLSIPDNDVQTFLFEIPKVPYHEIRSALEFRIEEYVPQKKDAIIFDYEIIIQNDRSYILRVCVAERSLIEKFETACLSAGLVLVHIEPHYQSLLRTVHPVLNDQEGFIIINRETETHIVFMYQGVIAYHRALARIDFVAPGVDVSQIVATMRYVQGIISSVGDITKQLVCFLDTEITLSDAVQSELLRRVHPGMVFTSIQSDDKALTVTGISEQEKEAYRLNVGLSSIDLIYD